MTAGPNIKIILQSTQAVNVISFRDTRLAPAAFTFSCEHGLSAPGWHKANL